MITGQPNREIEDGKVGSFSCIFVVVLTGQFLKRLAFMANRTQEKLALARMLPPHPARLFGEPSALPFSLLTLALRPRLCHDYHG